MHSDLQDGKNFENLRAKFATKNTCILSLKKIKNCFA